MRARIEESEFSSRPVPISRTGLPARPKLPRYFACRLSEDAGRIWHELSEVERGLWAQAAKARVSTIDDLLGVPASKKLSPARARRANAGKASGNLTKTKVEDGSIDDPEAYEMVEDEELGAGEGEDTATTTGPLVLEDAPTIVPADPGSTGVYVKPSSGETDITTTWEDFLMNVDPSTIATQVKQLLFM